MSDIRYAYSSVDAGPWKVVLWGGPDSNNWWIQNIQTGQFRKVGRLMANKVNYFSRAQELAAELNRKLALDK